MKQVALFLFTAIGLFSSCSPGQTTSADKFSDFKSKEKFAKDERLHYPGIRDPKMKPVLTEEINEAADDFKALADRGNATDKEYQDATETGLSRFSDVYDQLDTEDRERICTYFEELMDLVGLESSGGHLNNFMYGLDPTKRAT